MEAPFAGRFGPGGHHGPGGRGFGEHPGFAHPAMPEDHHGPPEGEAENYVGKYAVVLRLIKCLFRRTILNDPSPGNMRAKVSQLYARHAD